MTGRAVVLKINGKEMSLIDACNAYGISVQCLIPASIKRSPYVSREEKMISMIYKNTIGISRLVASSIWILFTLHWNLALIVKALLSIS